MPVILLSAAFTVVAAIYSSLWTLKVGRSSLEVASLAFGLFGALLVIRELFERTDAIKGSDQSRHLTTAAIWLLGGFGLMWWEGWNPAEHRFFPNLGVAVLDFGLAGLALLAIFKVLPRAERFIENERTRIWLGFALLIIGFLIQLRLALDPRLHS
jgi:hypothetical protein